MKKFAAILLVALLALSTCAFAETYSREDIRFQYDKTAFEISMDDHTDDEDLVILTGKNEAWGDTYIRIYLKDLDDGETFPTRDELNVMPDASEVIQGEWNGYKNVFMYDVANEDGGTTSFFIAPVMDDDGDEVEDLLSVEIGVSKIEDEEIAMGRDDLISDVVDSLSVND